MLSGFPHSEISGSQVICHLTEAYRRLSRLSSPLTAKASTVCASSLDHITPSNLVIVSNVKTTFAENLRLNSQIYLDHTCCSETTSKSLLLSHTQIFKEQSENRVQNSMLVSEALNSKLLRLRRLVEPRRIELLTSCVQSRRSPS